ncbi:hypothetical protein O3P69_020791 [Scylla paramamosain]|uniref:MADF domain-containing protein n=1 Tax=Scylla paramamosain TaxID=85552 RepID=A0AAW0TNP6_SCYPA
MQFKDVQKKRSLWEKKAQEFGLTTEHIQGWWRGMHTWFVKLHKVKSGQATKKLTDREMYVMQKCSFYEGQLRHRSTAPLKPLARDVEADALGQLSDVGASDAGDGPAGDGAAGAGLPLDPDSGQDQLLSQLKRGAVKLLRTPKRPAVGTTRRTAMEVEEVLKDIRDNMKVSTELLSQLVHKGNQGPREPFITYLSESLRTLPGDQYQVVMKHFTSFLHNLPHPAATPCAALVATTQESTQPQYTLMTRSTSTPSTSSAPGVASTPVSSALASAHDVLNMTLRSINLSGLADVGNSSFRSIGNLNTPRLATRRGDGALE